MIAKEGFEIRNQALGLDELAPGRNVHLTSAFRTLVTCCDPGDDSLTQRLEWEREAALKRCCRHPLQEDDGRKLRGCGRVSRTHAAAPRSQVSDFSSAPLTVALLGSSCWRLPAFSPARGALSDVERIGPLSFEATHSSRLTGV